MRLATCAVLIAAAYAAAPLGTVRIDPRDARYLALSTGKPYIPVGLNMIAPPRAANEEESWRVFTGWLDALAASSGNYIRVWLSNPFWDTEREKSGLYDETQARKIDRLLALCRARGIRVKMTIEHFRSIGGGRQAWADKPLHHVSSGGTAESIADFFDGEKSRARFREKIEWLGRRFGAREEVFGWELWNEINAVAGGDYLSWTRVMLPELHKAFPGHLAMQSMGSFDAARVRERYREHSLIETNGLAQVHRYLDLGAQLEVCKGAVDVLAADSVRELITYGVKKPVLLAESGAVEPRHTGPFKLYEADKEGIILHDVLFAPFFAGAAGAGQIWHWDSYVAKNNLWRHFGRFAELVKGLDPAAERFEPSVEDLERARVYVLKGRKRTLYWVRDKENTWMSELRDGRAPQPVAGLELAIARRKARVYDPWLGRWSDGKVKDGKLRLPEWTRSIVVIGE